MADPVGGTSRPAPIQPSANSARIRQKAICKTLSTPAKINLQLANRPAGNWEAAAMIRRLIRPIS